VFFGTPPSASKTASVKQEKVTVRKKDTIMWSQVTVRTGETGNGFGESPQLGPGGAGGVEARMLDCSVGG